MKYSFKDNGETAKALADILPAAKAVVPNWGDFDVLFSELNKAVGNNKTRVELAEEYETAESSGVRRYMGHLVDASLDFDGNVRSCKLSIELDLVPYGEAGHKKFTYVFDATLTEENTMSNPNSHEKIYLYSEGRVDKVLVTIIFHYI